MRRRGRAVGAFEPVLIEKRGEGGLAELDLPEDAEERGHRLLALALDAEDEHRAIRRVARAGLGSGAETEIDDAAALRRGELEMRHLVQQHIGLGLAA